MKLITANNNNQRWNVPKCQGLGPSSEKLNSGLKIIARLRNLTFSCYHQSWIASTLLLKTEN